jgi:hypothetical protein
MTSAIGSPCRVKRVSLVVGDKKGKRDKHCEDADETGGR